MTEVRALYIVICRGNMQTIGNGTDIIFQFRPENQTPFVIQRFNFHVLFQELRLLRLQLRIHIQSCTW